MESYTYQVGSNGFNKDNFENLCDQVGVIPSLTYGEPTQYGETLIYYLRMPEEVVGMITSFINDAPNKLLFTKNL